MSLEDQDRRLARLCAAIALGAWDEVRHVREVAPPGEPNRAWREAVLMMHLFAGFPRQVEAYQVLLECGGLGTPSPEEFEAAPDEPGRGRPIFEQVYGNQAAAVQAVLRRGHEDFARWIIGHAYGRVIGRPGMTGAQRELLAVAVLAVLDQRRQLVSHVRGALRFGATVEAVQGVIEAVESLMAEDVRARAHEVVAQLAKKA